MPREDLSLAERISLLDLLQTYGPGTTQLELSTHTGVPKSENRKISMKGTKQTTLHTFFNAAS